MFGADFTVDPHSLWPGSIRLWNLMNLSALCCLSECLICKSERKELMGTFSFCCTKEHSETIHSVLPRTMTGSRQGRTMARTTWNEAPTQQRCVRTKLTRLDRQTFSKSFYFQGSRDIHTIWRGWFWRAQCRGIGILARNKIYIKQRGTVLDKRSWDFPLQQSLKSINHSSFTAQMRASFGSWDKSCGL